MNKPAAVAACVDDLDDYAGIVEDPEVMRYPGLGSLRIIEKLGFERLNDYEIQVGWFRRYRESDRFSRREGIAAASRRGAGKVMRTC